MSWLSDLFRNTLKPTERELLEADAAWWKDCSDYWQAALKQTDAEACRLHSALTEIYAQGHDSKSGTARSMANKAKDALK